MGKVAIITGASSGVGMAIADRFASDGYDLVLAARREEILRELSDRLIKEYNVSAIPVRADLSKYDDIDNLLFVTRSQFGRLDVLVNVAGNFPDISFVESSVEEFLKAYEGSRKVMLDAVVYTIKAGLEMILESKGVIINISSDAGLEKKVYPNQVPYLAVKAAVNHATRGIDLEINGRGARAFALAPGNIDTPLLRRAVEENPEIKAAIEKSEGSVEEFYSKILKPEDIARKALEIAKNPKKYRHSVIEIPSYEF